MSEISDDRHGPLARRVLMAANGYPFDLDPMCLREKAGRYICVACNGSGLHRVCEERELCTDDYCSVAACRTLKCETCGGVGSWPSDPAGAVRRMFD
jgi:hypothetical protein